MHQETCYCIFLLIYMPKLFVPYKCLHFALIYLWHIVWKMSLVPYDEYVLGYYGSYSQNFIYFHVTFAFCLLANLFWCNLQPHYCDRGYRRSHSRSRDRCDRSHGRDQGHRYQSRSRSYSPDYDSVRGRSCFDNDRWSMSRSIERLDSCVKHILFRRWFVDHSC